MRVHGETLTARLMPVTIFARASATRAMGALRPIADCMMAVTALAVLPGAAAARSAVMGRFHLRLGIGQILAQRNHPMAAKHAARGALTSAAG